MDAATLKAEAERQAREGLRGPQPYKDTCLTCGHPFTFGTLASGANVWTMAGARDTQIVEMCEECFEELFDGEDDE